MGIYLKILAFTALVIGFAAFAPQNNACAGPGGGAAATIAPQTCDTQVWLAMNNRARIETEREIMQNQNLIYKPDSILAYTCFDDMAAHIGSKAGVLFTHTSYWSPMPINWGPGPPSGMDNAIQTVVINAMSTYLTTNFDHSMLGGRGNTTGLTLPNNSADMATASQNSTYGCGMMRDVWRVAKCLNFLHNQDFAATDGYYPFINLRGMNGDPNVDGYQTINETRRYPANMACSGSPLPGSTWNLEYRHSRNEVAYGNVNFHYDYGTPLSQAFDQVRQRVAPVGTPTATGAATCSDDVPTGITIIPSPGSTTTHPDGVCTNPGCTYTRAGNCVSTGTTTP